MRVFITGGTGWVGSGILRELLAAGHSVSALVRNPEVAKKLDAQGITPRIGDLRELDGLRAAASEADAVIHCAFDHHFTFLDGVGVVLVKLTRNPALARVAPVARTDLRAIEAMIDGLAAARAPSPKVLVTTSPIALLSPGRLGSEKDMGAIESFGCIRIASEQTALAAARRGIRSAVIRLPPSVHGAGDTGFVPTLLDIARKTGVSAYPGAGQNRWPAVHRDDAAALYRVVLDGLAAGTLPAGSVLHAVADQGVPFRDLAAAISDRLSLGPAESRKSRHFGSFAMFAGIDNPATGALTQELTGWRPTRPSLLEDVRGAGYARVASR